MRKIDGQGPHLRGVGQCRRQRIRVQQARCDKDLTRAEHPKESRTSVQNRRPDLTIGRGRTHNKESQLSQKARRTAWKTVIDDRAQMFSALTESSALLGGQLTLMIGSLTRMAH
ncbi:hypothetical protein SCOCK_50196 [Actinacidiphila cocklensis]|uniref:Uncharacterized protein n=1 Tax=Actinacidiphila cocklensis TaxID=887465 RepID=A0A9W4DWD6_9ACTN|nr:hypothetical protein SCOCK_50196 [Actinacidiphila cocklensis]